MAPDSSVPIVTGTRMVRVATTRDGFEARVIAARLGAEGIVWELKGSVDGPYPVGVVHVLVEAGEVDAARELLTLEPEDGDDVEEDGDHDPVGSASWRGGIVTAVAVVVVALMGLARLLALL